MSGFITQEKIRNQPSFNEMFSGRQSRQDVKFSDVSGGNTFPNFRASWRFVPKFHWIPSPRKLNNISICL